MRIDVSREPEGPVVATVEVRDGDLVIEGEPEVVANLERFFSSAFRNDRDLLR